MILWFVSLASLLGVVLNIRRHVACFWIWTFTNAAWAWADFTHGLHAQAALMLVYMALSIWGIWTWSARPKGGLPGVSATSQGSPP